MVSAEMVAAISGFVGVVLTAAVAYLKYRLDAKKAEQIAKTAKPNLRVEQFSDFFGEATAILNELRTLEAETCIDRWLFLVAENGYLEPRYTTAIVQLRDGNAVTLYIDVEVDKAYNLMLKEAANAGHIHMSTSDMGPCELRDIYVNEGVVESYLMHLYFDSNDRGGTMHAYCTYATHENEPITLEVQTRCKLINSRIRRFAEKYGIDSLKGVA